MPERSQLRFTSAGGKKEERVKVTSIFIVGLEVFPLAVWSTEPKSRAQPLRTLQALGQVKDLWRLLGKMWGDFCW